ncbi:M48 family metalloprotease [Neorhodopirellula lusitana]|uniref:M48 family metalloprotease n=1 Tax=Neorhodopirellula lusitana TaxID=445327 RepID=UPI00384F17D3
MTLYFFLLVIVSLMCGSAPAAGEISPRSVLATITMLTGWVVLIHIAGRWMAHQVKRGELHFVEAADYLRTQMEIFRWFALPITIMCHYGFSLAAYIRIQPVLESSMFLQACVLLWPGLTLLASTWSAEYYFAASVGTQPRTFRSYSAAMGRMMRAGPAWLVVPTLLFMGLGDIFEMVQTSWFGSASLLSGESSWMVWAVIGLGGCLVALLLPYLVRWMAKTQPLHPEIEKEIQTWLQRCGMSTHRFWGMHVARWDTGGRMLNAMVAGLIRPGRLLLISDRLIDELPRGQRLMVLMHELAHVKRWHVPLRMAAMMPAWFVSSCASKWLIEYGMMSEPVGAVVGGLLGLVTTVMVLGGISHFCELDADATACRLAVRACQRQDRHSPEDADGAPEVEMTLAMAAELMADALVRVTADHPASRKMSWLHPSLATRVGRLRRIANREQSGGSDLVHGNRGHSDRGQGDRTHPLPDPGSEGHTLAI